ncbi:MAG TPA: phage tail family protein [Clostridia bacterium]
MKLIYENEKGESITFDTFPPFFLSNVNGIDGIKNIFSTQKSPYQDGNTLLNKTLDVRDISLSGLIIGKNLDEIKAYRRQMLKVFNPKLSGELTYIYNDSKKKIKCEVENAPSFSEDNVTRVQKFVVNLYCNDPFWTDAVETQQEIAGWVGGFNFPLELSSSGIEMGTKLLNIIVNINNPGDVDCGNKIIFKALASVTNPQILNTVTGEYIKINKVMAAGDVITLTTDFGNKKVLLNGNNAFSLIDLNSTFFQLSVGDNLLKYQADANVNNLEVYVYYTPKYLGI